MCIELIAIEFLIGISSLSKNVMLFHYSLATSTDLWVLNGGYLPQCVTGRLLRSPKMFSKQKHPGKDLCTTEGHVLNQGLITSIPVVRKDCFINNKILLSR